METNTKKYLELNLNGFRSILDKIEKNISSKEAQKLTVSGKSLPYLEKEILNSRVHANHLRRLIKQLENIIAKNDHLPYQESPEQ